ncbi:hypothetical protein [Collimonas silvisoli]|uniref:hypothetical protein n=1 Tax=Collimonas silvisoli TaxID=2825884 RepID=UPI001B8C578B|nr:hypothetical protein [Collimonas silvisoli]
MDFSQVWLAIQSELTPGASVMNWTVTNGYLGDTFRIVAVSSLHVDVDAPNAETIQRVAKSDFEFMFSHWKDYCAGKVKRKDLVKSTRVSKYTMSILHHLEI